MDTAQKHRIMLSHVRELVMDAKWTFFRDYLTEALEDLLVDLEGVSQDKNAYIILGKIKTYRNILHLDANTINILMNSTPDGPVGE